MAEPATDPPVAPGRPPLGAPAGQREAVRIEGVSKRFGALLANDDVGFAIPAGRVLGLVGENGAGKTTVMNVLAGLYLPDAGTVTIAGAPLRLGSPKASVAAGIGMVHQQLKLVDTLTGIENLSLAQHRGRLLQRSEAGPELRALMAELGFEIDLSAQVWQMPLAIRQQLEILRTLAIGARLLILDEPTSVLSPPETVRLFRIVRRIAGSGRAVVLISHKLGEVLGVADELVVMRGGRVVYQGPAHGVDVGRLARLIVGDRDLGQGGRPAGPFGEPMLRVQDLTVESDLGLAAVRGASLSVRAGELVAIVGVAGNGQTELVQAIGGVRPYHGAIAPAARHARRFAYIPAQHLGVGLAPGMSIRDNALLGQQRRPPFGWWLRRRSVERRGREVADRFGVRADLASPVRWLSGGNLQRLVLGRELHGDPALIVADYPTRGLDVASAGQIRRALVARASAGAAVLISSEELEESLAIANRILVMHRGEIVAEHDPRRVDHGMLGRQMTTGRC
ncbi:MAG TPA: ATP-binding cassette domain-containing protein [Geminicoccaceae bacterium]|nr:ATP-binding cassette domain-containing protein [Geminicoccaceae bacterium]